MVMDAKTGAPLWEYPAFKEAPKRHRSGSVPVTLNACPLLVGDTVIWYDAKERRVVALAQEDGSVRWTDGLKLHHRYPRLLGVTELDGRKVILATTNWLGGQLALLDATTGETLWVKSGPKLGHIGTTLNDALLSGSLLVTVRRPRKGEKPRLFKARGWRLTLEGVEHLWDGEPFPASETPTIALGGGLLYATGLHTGRMFDAGTGRQLGAIPARIGDNAYAMPIADAGNPGAGKVIVSPEGQHGHQTFFYYQERDRVWTQLGEVWDPPHPTTTAYNTQPLIHPVVDGRIFIRGGNGIYCYDLRKQDTEANEQPPE
jgi:outer membrane protein assembly factor BamB